MPKRLRRRLVEAAVFVVMLIIPPLSPLSHREQSPASQTESGSIIGSFRGWRSPNRNSGTAMHWGSSLPVADLELLPFPVCEAVYEGLHRTIGRRWISQFIEKLARPHVVPLDMEASYRDMAADQAREQEAMDWSEGLIADSSLAEPHASRWNLVVDFDPSLGGEIQKTRPAVIVSNGASNRNLNGVQVVPITSNVTHVYRCEAPIATGVAGTMHPRSLDDAPR